MKCPVDGTTLSMTERSGVEIDYCPTCRGVWLDRGELDKIIERAAAELAPEPAPAPAAPPAPPPQAAPSGAPWGEAPRHRDDRGYRDERDYRDDRYRDDREYRGHHGGYYKKKKRKSILSEIFDFD